MDRPYIHESRYVPISSPPSNPCLYRPQIYHQSNNNNYLPPPPPPPPPPPQLLPPPPQQLRRRHHHPPPVTKVPFNSQFQFSPDFSPSPNPKPPHQRSNDFGHRTSINDDRHQRIDHRQHLAADFNTHPDLWDRPPRSLPDHGPLVSNLDHHQFHHRPTSPYLPLDNIKHELDTSYRFRERYINDIVQFEYKSSNNSNQRVEFVPHHSHFVSDADRLTSTASSYDNQHGSQFHSDEFMNNNVRDVVLDRHVLRDRESRDSFFGRGSNYDNGDNGVRAFGGKHEFSGSDSGRYGTNRGSREDNYEYNRTPRKQVQKKSALLRIQKPYYRNRDDEELHYLGNEMKPGSFRGKDHVVFPEREVGECEQRGGSPVELDVSFKSNSLVAKAIMAPSSSAIVSDANLTTKKGNTRKIIMSDKDHSSSPMKKPFDCSRKLDGSRDSVNSRDSKQSENKGAPSGAKTCDNNSQTRSSGSKNSPAKIIVEKSNVVPEKWGTDVGTSKTSSLKVAKKKKVAKVVKKAINPTELFSSSQPTEKQDEPVKADGSTLSARATIVLKTGVKPSKYKITSVAMAPSHLEDAQPYTNEANMFPGNDLVGGSPQAAMKSGEVSPDGNSCVPCITEIKRKRTNSFSPLASSSHKETKTEEGSVNDDNCLHVLYTASNTGKDLTKLLSETNFSDIGRVEGADNQFCHNGHSLLLENAETKESPETLIPEGRYINSDLLRLGEDIMHESLVNTCSFAHGMKTNTTSNNGLLSSQEKITNSDIGIQNTSTQQHCRGQMSLSGNRSTVEGFPLVIPPGRYEIPALSSSDETGINSVSIHSGCSNREKCSVSDFDNFSDNSEITPGTGDFNARKQARNEVTISLENSIAEEFPNTIFSVGSSKEDMSNNTEKRKVMMPLSDLPDAMISERFMGLVKSVSSAKSVNTTLSVKDCCLAEVRVSEGMDANGLSVICGHNSTGGCCETNVSDSGDLNGASPENRKRRKVSASFPGCSSVISSEISEGPVTPDLSTSGVQLLSNSNEGLIQPEEVIAVSNIDALFASSSPACTSGITVLLENSLARVSSEVAVSVSRDASGFGDDSLKVEPQRADSSSALGGSMSSRPPRSESKQIVNKNLVLDGSNYNDEVMCMENNKSENVETFVVGEQVKACNEVTESQTPPEHLSPDFLNQLLPVTDVVSDGCLYEKGDFPSASAYRALAAEGDGVSTTNFNDELMEFDSASSMGSPEIFSTGPVMSMMNHEASTSQISNEKGCGIDKLPNEKPVDEGTSNLSAHTSPSEHAKINWKLDYLLESAHLLAGKTVSLPAQDVKGTGHNLNLTSGETYRKKNQPSHSFSRVPPRSSSSVFTTSRNVLPSTCTINPRTWHRTESSSAAPAPGNKSFLRTVPPPNQLPAKFQSMTYLRKGNSLVRKPAPVAALPQVSHGLTSSVFRLNSSGIGDSKKTRGSESSADVIGPPNFLRVRGVNAPSERPRTPPLPVVAKVPNQSTNSTGDCTSSPVADPFPNCVSETMSDPQKLEEINDELDSSNAALKLSETPVKPTGSVNSLESQDDLSDGTLSNSDVKRITYLKRKSNQLIAASNDSGLSVQNPNRTQSTTSDVYFKRRKNQLIRTPMESRINQTVSSAGGSFTSEGGKCSKVFRSSNKNQSYKAVKKIRKPLSLSLVWTLNSMQSSKNDLSSYRQKVLPYLFPWKRTVYWRRFAQDSVSISNGSCLSAISRKLLLLRQRETVYTRSNHGFSLRKSKVLSVGGSSLKWSKSIENRSKKVNEEATLAVAAVEKRQKNGAESFPSETENRSRSCRGRIFRIGSVRYKMDSSRRTLQRISDDESSCAAAPSSGKNANKSYIPRRLVIGNDEYVRIGNGNQLVRDPKKRARVLASEKVRWSLHTARLRLARKRKYCQFFTRFGKCNKGDGKCPYIHDPSKIAVCTKFLNGLCSNSDCKLTHKVIPERMPDCSYFLQGLCTNKNCPYRHVHVNPNASTCEGFLKGYCADGNECRKKHSYVCPTFEATGSCPLGSKCKLHHPKCQRKGKKSRRSRKQKRTHGRYFGSMVVEDPEPQITMLERHSIQDNDNLFIEGKLADYIDLDISEEEAGEANDGLHEPTIFNESDASDLQLDDLDELIKPIRIMKSPVGSFSPG